MAKISGSIFRRILFWAHLSCGVAAGVLILIMSVTGVLLTYERQIIGSSAEANRVSVPDDAVRLTADQLIDKARAAAPPDAKLNLIFDADPTRPVTAAFGRTQLLLHPLTGEILPDAAADVRSFFGTMQSWHRRLGGESGSTRAKVLYASNLIFVFTILSGIYLWLPAVWKWPILRMRMLFRSEYASSHARDFNWHHIFSFWMFIPLFLIAFSGTVFSYPWVNKLVFAAYGEAPPQGPGPPGTPTPTPAPAANAPAPGEAAGVAVDAPVQHASAQQLLEAARSQSDNWQRITLPASMPSDRIDLSAELKSDSPRPPRQILTLSTQDASVIYLSPVPTPTPAQRARTWLRFIHTGEVYGVLGQTIAGLASLAACFLAYTGLALAWRRLIVPLYRRS